MARSNSIFSGENVPCGTLSSVVPGDKDLFASLQSGKEGGRWNVLRGTVALRDQTGGQDGLRVDKAGA